jgi:hypothetical protein
MLLQDGQGERGEKGEQVGRQSSVVSCLPTHLLALLASPTCSP